MPLNWFNLQKKNKNKKKTKENWNGKTQSFTCLLHLIYSKEPSEWNKMKKKKRKRRIRSFTNGVFFVLLFVKKFYKFIRFTWVTIEASWKLFEITKHKHTHNTEKKKNKKKKIKTNQRNGI